MRRVLHIGFPLAVLCLLLAARDGWAQSLPLADAATPVVAPQEEPSVLSLPPVVVTSRRAGARSPLELDRTVYSTSSGRLAELQPDSVPAAVADLPGTWGQQTNRGAGAPLLRGLIGPQNLILIEGLRLNNATFRTGPNQYLATIDPSAVDRIEVQPGPGGVLFGSDAMGGAVNLFLPALPAFGLSPKGSARLWLTEGTVDNTQAIGGQGSWSNNWLAVEAGGAYRSHGALTAGGGSTVRASDFGQWGWHARVAAALTDAWQLSATVLHNGIDSAGRIDDLGKGILRTYDNQDLFGWVELRRQVSALSSWLRDLRVALVYHRQHEVGGVARCTLTSGKVPSLDGCASVGQTVNRTLPVALPDTVTRQDEFVDTTTTIGALATAQLAFLQDRARVSVGAEGWFDSVDSTARQRKNIAGSDTWTSLARGNFSSGSTYTQLGAFAHVDATVAKWSDWQLLLSGGARGGIVMAAADNVPAIGNVRFALPVVAATGGAVLKFRDWASVFVNLSNGLRAPNLQETTVLGNTGDQFEVPNADLKAERIQATEVGMRARLAGWSAQVAGYVSSIDGFIDRATVATSQYAQFGINATDLGCTALGDAKCKSVSQRVNIASADIAGAELSLRGPGLWGVHPWAMATWLQGDTNSGATTQPIRREPPPTGAAGLRWASADGRWYVEPWVRGASGARRLNSGDTKDLRICEDPAKPGVALAAGSCYGSDPWWTLNLRAGWRWPVGLPGLQAVRVDLDGGNLLDTRYRIHGSGFDAPGRGVNATLTAQW